MPVTRWRKNPIEFDAIQFTGDNEEEVRAFCGGSYFFFDRSSHARLWVEANKTHLTIEIGEWIIRDSVGLYPCKDEIMRKNNTEITDGSEPMITLPVNWAFNYEKIIGRAVVKDNEVRIVISWDEFVAEIENLVKADQVKMLTLGVTYLPVEEKEEDADAPTTS